MPIQFRPRYKDPFSPVLLSDPPPVGSISEERKSLIKSVLDVACSDSRFAQKAYDAITLILTGMKTVLPSVTSLTPNSAELGDPSFTLHVHGTGFKSSDSIIFAGQVEPTTFVSQTELTTGVDMSVWLGPDVLPVMVQSLDGSLSNQMSFTFTDGSVVMTAQKKDLKSPLIPSHPITHTEKK